LRKSRKSVFCMLEKMLQSFSLITLFKRYEIDLNMEKCIEMCKAIFVPAQNSFPFREREGIMWFWWSIVHLLEDPKCIWTDVGTFRAYFSPRNASSLHLRNIATQQINRRMTTLQIRKKFILLLFSILKNISSFNCTMPLVYSIKHFSAKSKLTSSGVLKLDSMQIAGVT